MLFPLSLLPTLTFLLALPGISHAGTRFLVLQTDSLLCMPFYTLLFSFNTYLHVRAVSFYFTNVYYSIDWINHNLFNQSPSDGHFHCFLSFAIKNNAVVNILVQMLFHIISMGLCLWVQLLEIRVVCGEGDRVDGYRIGMLFIVSPFVSLWILYHMYYLVQKNKIFLNTAAGHRLLKCSLSLYIYLTLFYN